MRKFGICSILLCLLWLFGGGEVFAQQVSVKGVVLDDSGATLPGVNVVVKGTTSGTITGPKGQFELKVPDSNSILQFSFIGFTPREIPVNGNTNIKVILEEKVSKLDQVIVVGYGTQKKSDLTGSVAVVKVDEMKKTSDSDMGNLLKGRIAGVDVTSDGEPGASPSIRIRGYSSFNDYSPLYVIDGVPVGTSARDFSPDDIASVQVLKDASAAAIYGSRAANGVIIITTKHGRKNSPLKVSYKGYVGIDQIYQKIPVLHRQNYQMMYNRALTNNGEDIYSANDSESDDYIDDVDTDWQDASYQTGYRQDHNLTFTGGGNVGTYAVSLDYYKTEGTLVGKGPDYNRYTARVNNTAEKGILKIGTSLVYSHSEQNDLENTSRSEFSGSNPALVIRVLAAIPTMKVYDSSTTSGYGTYDADTQGETYSLNPVAVNYLLEENTTVDRMAAHGYAQLDLGKVLKLKNQTLSYKLNLSYDKTHCHDFDWVPAFSLSTFYTNSEASLSEAWRQYTTGLIENTLHYNGKFGKHNLDVLLGQSYQSGDYYQLYGYGQGFEEPYYKKLTNAEESTSTSTETHHYIDSYFGRLNYNYDERYLLTATLRRDGSSRFSEANRFGYFPSVGLGWNINKENFFPFNEHAVSQLKLRGSWGELGNENIGEYAYMESISTVDVYNFNGSVVYGSSNSSIVDDNLKWETKRTFNIALDATLLDDAFDFTAEYYKSRNKDVLVDVSIPLSVGSIDSSPTTNAGVLDNSGWEFSLTYHASKHAFRYNVTGTLSTLKNKVVSLGENGDPIYGTGSRTMEGSEVGRQFGYVYDGIFQSQDEIDESAFQNASTAPGDIKFKDLNDDGTIDTDDRTDLGSSIPNLHYGLNFTADYKHFDFTLFASGASGFKIYSALYHNLMHTSGGSNWHKDILNSWTETNTDTDIPRVQDDDPNENDRNSNRPGWLQNGTYLKISNISLGYTFPKKLIQKVCTGARIYISCQNVYTFSKYKGYNPDYNQSDTWAPGYNSGSYPIPRTYMFGVNLDF